MACRNCGHTPHQHDDAGCRVVVLTHWDADQNRFQDQRACGCTAYAERVAVAVLSPTGCPHEVAKDLGPNCVHCGRGVIENVM